MEGFPSGQREQTVNLPAKPTEVRTLPPPPVYCSWTSGSRKTSKASSLISGSSAVARASAFQAEGRGFESRFPLQFVRHGAVRFSGNTQPVRDRVSSAAIQALLQREDSALGEATGPR